MFKDSEQRDKVGGELGHALYYQAEQENLQHLNNQFWRVALRRELEVWYAAHPPIGKRRQSQGASTIAVDPTRKKLWANAELYVDSDAEQELEDPNAAVAAGRALAAVASAAAGAGGAGQ